MKFSRPLWKHQADVIERFKEAREAALFHEMGTGKTTSCIGLIRHKYRLAGEVLPTLIISPIATLTNWKREFELNAPENVYKFVAVVEGTAAKREKILKDPDKKIFIINPEALGTARIAALLTLMKFKVLAIDEVHVFKNPKSVRLKALMPIARSAMYRIIMTGTPILNSYLDLFSQFLILDGGKTFGENFFVFREKYFMDKNLAWKGRANYFPNYVPRPETSKLVTALISAKSSRVEKKDCLDLPPLVRMSYAVPMSDSQEKAYSEIVNEMLTELDLGVITASNALVKTLRLLQIVSGFGQVERIDGEKLPVFFDNPRDTQLKELLEELTPSHKVIVWATFKENYRAIRKVLTDLGIGWAELTGETTDRQDQIDRFQNDPLTKVMLANPQAGGVGVNMTAASYAIYYSRGFSLGQRLQSEARNYRGGSEIHDKITLIDLVAPNTIEVDVLRALENKEDLSVNLFSNLRKLLVKDIKTI